MIRRRNFRQIVAGLLLAMPFVFGGARARGASGLPRDQGNRARPV